MTTRSRPTALMVLIVGVALSISCTSKTSSGPSEDSNNKIVSSTPPFQTKEPKRYHAVRTITSTDSAGNKLTTTTSIDRYDELRREETELAPDKKMVLLENENGRFAVLPTARLFAPVQAEESLTGATNGEELNISPEGLLHRDQVQTTYEKIGSEQISGRNGTKYRAVVNARAGSSVSNMETLIWIDDELGMPIRSETRGGDGSTTVMEMTDLRLKVDPGLFKVPEGFTSVTLAQLRKRVLQN